MNRADVERWITGYRKAWATDDPADISALFTDDAVYSPFPWPRAEGDWEGHDEIVFNWTGRGDSKLKWRFDHTILAVDGDTAVVEGRTFYDATDEDPETAFANVWIIQFGDNGRARSFREWWVERPTG